MNGIKSIESILNCFSFYKTTFTVIEQHQNISREGPDPTTPDKQVNAAAGICKIAEIEVRA